MTTQLPVEHWHAWPGDQTMADAFLDRLLVKEHRISLKGDSLRLTAGSSILVDKGGIDQTE